MASLDQKIKKNLKQIEKQRKRMQKFVKKFSLKNEKWEDKCASGELTPRQCKRGMRRIEEKAFIFQVKYERAAKRITRRLKQNAKIEWREARTFNTMVNQKMDYLAGLVESREKSYTTHDYQNPDNISRAVHYLMGANSDALMDEDINPYVLEKRLYSLQDQNITDVGYELDEDDRPNLEKLLNSVEKHEKDLSDAYTALLLVNPVATSHQEMPEVYKNLSEAYKQRFSLVRKVAHYYGPFIDRYRRAFIMGSVFSDNREREPDFSTSDEHYERAHNSLNFDFGPRQEVKDRIIAACFEKPSRRIAFLVDPAMENLRANNIFMRISPAGYKKHLWAACKKIAAQKTEKQASKKGLLVLQRRMPKETFTPAP